MRKRFQFKVIEMAKLNRNVINSHKKFKFNAIQVDFDVDLRLSSFSC